MSQHSLFFENIDSVLPQTELTQLELLFDKKFDNKAKGKKDPYYWMTQVVTDVTREVRADIGHYVMDSPFCYRS